MIDLRVNTGDIRKLLNGQTVSTTIYEGDHRGSYPREVSIKLEDFRPAKEIPRITVVLNDRAGKFVANFQLPGIFEAGTPKVIIWELRVYMLQDPAEGDTCPQYREVFYYAIPIMK